MLYNRAVPGNTRYRQYPLFGLLLFIFVTGGLSAKQAPWITGNSNPEDLLIAKEMARFVFDHFSRTEIDYLLGEIDLTEAAAVSGISCEAFRKRLERRKVDFRKAMKLSLIHI